ncbi:MAG: alkaline phosphatase D family protein [Woeseiaceae bacterium]
MNRRGFLINTLLGLGGSPLMAPLASDIRLPTDPFTLGIASGDVTDSSAVLWTRLAPEPLEADGGMEPYSIPVQWELSLDPKMSRVVRRGEAIATPTLAHSVHVDLDGLEPCCEYWYRFSVLSHASRIGRTKTLPRRDSQPDSVRFITASCQNYTHGYFVAYEHMIQDKPDFIIHLGDYFYDTSFGVDDFRKHETEKAPVTVADFRQRHALYKTDKQLQHAHSQIPFFTTIDNHDAIEDMDPGKFAQRAAAYQAWYEHMPVRGYKAAGDNHFDLHRKISLGELVQISLLDGRQFRDSKEVCNNNDYPDYGFGNYRERCDDVFSEDRSMLGQEQERWLTESLIQNKANWNVIASPGPYLPFRYQVDGKELSYIGAWDIYPANRKRIAEAIETAEVGHPLILSGDVHSFWAVDGRLTKQSSERIPVVEFVASSISANWPEQLAKPVTENLVHNPQVQFYDPGRRGYLLHDVTETEWKTTARAMEDVRNEQSPALDLAIFIVSKGKPGFARLK